MPNSCTINFIQECHDGWIHCWDIIKGVPDLESDKGEGKSGEVIHHGLIESSFPNL